MSFHSSDITKPLLLIHFDRPAELGFLSRCVRYQPSDDTNTRKILTQCCPLLPGHCHAINRDFFFVDFDLLSRRTHLFDGMRRCLWIYCDINNGHNRIGSLHIPCSTGGKSSISSGLCVLTLASPLLSLLPDTYKKDGFFGCFGTVVLFCGL